MMKYIQILFIFFISQSYLFSAEVIDNVRNEKRKFIDWVVECNQDMMSDIVNCKAYASFYDNNSFFFIQPNNKIANQVVIIIPSVLENTIVQVKVDKNSVIHSDFTDKSSLYGVIPFSPQKQKMIFDQLKFGKNVYIRFSVKDSKSPKGQKDITAKISLKDFQQILLYYNSKINK